MANPNSCRHWKAYCEQLEPKETTSFSGLRLSGILDDLECGQAEAVEPCSRITPEGSGYCLSDLYETEQYLHNRNIQPGHGTLFFSCTW